VFNKVPFNNDHTTAAAAGFQTGERDLDLWSLIPTELNSRLAVGVASTNVTVEAGADLVETDPEIHTDVDRKLFEKLPLESQSSSLSSLVTLYFRTNFASMPFSRWK